MQRWWKYVVKDYLTFTRKERIGLLLFVVLIFSIYLIPKLFKPKRVAPNYTEFNKQLAQLKISVDSAKSNNRFRNDEDDRAEYTPSARYKKEETVKGELFNFDPNILDETGWKRLGVRDRTIQTIQKLVSKGFTFRHPEDIKKIYGLKPEEADRLIPYIQITPKEHTAFAAYTAKPHTETYTAHTPAINNKPIDINEADSTAFIALPGIGSKLAMRIINFRDKLGGFIAVGQVGETYGVPDSTFQKIKPRLQCNSHAPKTININTADVNALKAHPYLRWNIANAIINFRQQHGLYKAVDELKKIDIITEEVFAKVAPYLVVSN